MRPRRLLPAGARDVARFFSEGLLVVIAAILVVVSARRRTLVGAVRHPFSLALAVLPGGERAVGRRQRGAAGRPPPR